MIVQHCVIQEYLNAKGFGFCNCKTNENLFTYISFEFKKQQKYIIFSFTQ